MSDARITGTVTMHCARGKVDVSSGDRFKWRDGTEWEVVGFTGATMYSPSGLGGTPIVVCKHLAGELRGSFKQYTDADGLCEWCGDSVASAVLSPTP